MRQAHWLVTTNASVLHFPVFLLAAQVASVLCADYSSLSEALISNPAARIVRRTCHDCDLLALAVIHGVTSDLANCFKKSRLYFFLPSQVGSFIIHMISTFESCNI